jgi:transposase
MIQSPERESEGWAEILGPYVGIHKKIDDWILGDGYSRPEVAMILYEIFLTTRDSDGILQGDGTGLERTRKQNYESQKKNCDGWYMTSIVDSREIVIENLFMIPYIYPKSNNNLNGDDSWKYMYLYFFWDIYAWLKEYHQRSHTESFHSAFKRVYGEVRKIGYTARFVQVCARIILHNFRRMSYFNRCN